MSFSSACLNFWTGLFGHRWQLGASYLCNLSIHIMLSNLEFSLTGLVVCYLKNLANNRVNRSIQLSFCPGSMLGWMFWLIKNASERARLGRNFEGGVGPVKLYFFNAFEGCKNTIISFCLKNIGQQDTRGFTNIF